MDRLRIWTALTMILALGAGCAWTTFYETARTTPPGKVQVGGSVTPINVVLSEEGGGGVFFPIPEAYAKLGVSENLDLGARWAFGPGITLNGKLQFLRGRTDAAFHCAGSFYGFFAGGAGFGAFSLVPRLVLSSEQRGSFPYMANLGVGYTGLFAGGDGEMASGGAMGLVGGVGLPFRIGPTRSLIIQPELGANVPLFSSVSYGGENEFASNLGSLALNFGVSFGYAPTSD